MLLTNKRALVTGGTKGIGAAIAIDLARQGCDVAINGRMDDESGAAVRQAISATWRGRMRWNGLFGTRNRDSAGWMCSFIPRADRRSAPSTIAVRSNGRPRS